MTEAVRNCSGLWPAIPHTTLSQDGNDSAVAATVRSRTPALRGTARSFTHWQRPRIPVLGPKQPGYAWLAQHYRWALDRVFLEQGHSHVVIVEDDMVFSPDFLTLFNETAWLLDADPTIWCISSWFRTSYFPGLGWMLRARLWRELSPHWPDEHWDHWMRMESVARGRDCVSPELNRNKNIGEVGANMDASLYRRWLGHMDWAEPGRAGLPKAGAGAGASASRARNPRALAPPRPGQTVLITYGVEQYQRLAQRLHIWKSPRGHYRHASAIPWKGGTVLLADARECDLLPPELRWEPTPGWTVHLAAPNVSCTAACRAVGLACSTVDLHFINTCPGLQNHMSCPAGCGLDWGQDLPHVTGDPARTKCFVTQQIPTCRGAGTGSRRVCPCVAPEKLSASARAALRIGDKAVGVRDRRPQLQVQADAAHLAVLP
ncbi:hypothetical protein QBZ16_002218 [Prototheca wickerhamii]|uniref:Alpha-1,3-mannosyl-glycoprotein 2-beta-N-acetylglucosaminyltransferase n=1 Tax=Prototheca wickerhamii TaxID=3111 RepID=A0AAD9IK84_PROWI|nr:hypothetical protein QBZ16_002218 [Prototheca wickerhamii]